MSSTTGVAAFTGLMLASTVGLGAGLRGHRYDDVK
jgi:hypothetical protein